MLDSRSRQAHVLGARGGGKSHGILLDFAKHAYKYGSHVAGVLFRRTYPELEDLQSKAQRIFPFLGASYKAGARTWNFASGATRSAGHR